VLCALFYINNIDNIQAFSEDDDSGLDDDTRAAAQLTALTEVIHKTALLLLSFSYSNEHTSM
jgi:hypothetical protein